MNTVDVFSIAKSLKNKLSEVETLSGLNIWLFNYPAVETGGILIVVTHNQQSENFEKYLITVDIAIKDKKENIKTILNRFQNAESALVGNMIELSDGAGNEYCVLRFLPIGNRITEFSEDKINLYHYRLYRAVVVKTA